MPEPGLERDLNFERRGDLRRAFFVPKTQSGAYVGVREHRKRRWRRFRGNDMHENKDLKRVATRFRYPQNFLLPMTLK
jgi:hypothetical protein